MVMVDRLHQQTWQSIETVNALNDTLDGGRMFDTGVHRQ